MTEFIKQLKKPALRVGRSRQRVLENLRATITESSDLADDASYSEEYRMDVRFMQTMRLTDKEQTDSRLRDAMYREIVHGMVHAIYGEIRDDLRLLIPEASCISDREIREKVLVGLIDVIKKMEI